jgi:hypothetical protein
MSDRISTKQGDNKVKTDKQSLNVAQGETERLKKLIRANVEKVFDKNKEKTQEFMNRSEKELKIQKNIEYNAEKHILVKHLDNAKAEDISQVKKANDGYSYTDKEGNRQEITDKEKLNEIEKDLSSLRLQKNPIPDAIEKPLLDHLAEQKNNEHLKNGIVHSFDKQEDQLKIYVVPEVKEAKDGTETGKIKDGEMKEFSIDLDKPSPEKTNLTYQMEKHLVASELSLNPENVNQLRRNGEKYSFEDQDGMPHERKLDEGQKENIEKNMSKFGLHPDDVRVPKDVEERIIEHVKSNDKYKDDMKNGGILLYNGADEGMINFSVVTKETKDNAVTDGKTINLSFTHEEYIKIVPGPSDDLGKAERSDAAGELDGLKRVDASKGKNSNDARGNDSGDAEGIERGTAEAEGPRHEVKELTPNEKSVEQLQAEKKKSDRDHKRLNNFLMGLRIANDSALQSSQVVESVIIARLLQTEDTGSQQMPPGSIFSQGLVDRHHEHGRRQSKVMQKKIEIAKNGQPVEEEKKKTVKEYAEHLQTAGEQNTGNTGKNGGRKDNATENPENR